MPKRVPVRPDGTKVYKAERDEAFRKSGQADQDLARFFRTFGTLYNPRTHTRSNVTGTSRVHWKQKPRLSTRSYWSDAQKSLPLKKRGLKTKSMTVRFNH